MEGVLWDMKDVAAVELRAPDGPEDVVEDVSRLRLYPAKVGDSGRLMDVS